MLSLHRTLSLRYLSRRWFRALLIVASIMLGVATLVATQALSDTMTRAALASGNPMAGTIDLIVTNGELPIDRELKKDIETVAGVKKVRVRVFDQAKLVVAGKKQAVMIMGVDLAEDQKNEEDFETHFELDPKVKAAIEERNKAEGATTPMAKPNSEQIRQDFNATVFGEIPAIVGKELDTLLKNEPNRVILGWDSGLKPLTIEKNLKRHSLLRVARVKPQEDGDLAALGGYVVILGLDNAATVLGIPKDKARRIDVALYPGTDPKKARKDLEVVLRDRAEVRTIEEQNQALQSAMVGMKTGFSMCGVAALVVGMFLVYNSLSVGVAERRHEIGILLALGATRDQIWRLFAGEAFVLGCAGSALGIPLGLGLAYLGLQPMQDAISDVFSTLNLRQVELSTELVVLAFVVGILSALVASLVPAVQAAYDKPADAVRRVPKEPTVSHIVMHIGFTLALILVGMSMILVREYLPRRWGTYGGLGMVMVGALMAAPLLAHLAARGLVPIARRFFPIEWRLAADNLIRSPGRTGLVIGALAAGVCLTVETAGIIRSNRLAIREWVDTSIGADIVITSGSPVGSGGQTSPMEESLGDTLREMPEVEEAIPIRQCTEILFRNVRISIITTVADRAYAIEKDRLSKRGDLELYKTMDHEKNAIIVSENFAALHHVHKGDFLTLKSPRGEVKLHVIGTVVDYSWNLGTIVMNRADYVYHWQDRSVTIFDVYLRPNADPVATKKKIESEFGAKYDLHPLTRDELQSHIDDMIERLYSVAYAQQIVVMLVAALGVVTALLISVLQRRREMGLLRAIGASQAQVVYLVLSEAFLMGIFGTIIGLLMSLPLQWYALQVVFLEESGYHFPVYVPWVEGPVVALMAMVVTTLAGVGPALYAVRQRIPEAIAYE